MRILLNAVNVIGAGATVVVQNLLDALPIAGRQHRFTAVIPGAFDTAGLTPQDNLELIRDGRRLPRTVTRLEDIARDVAVWCRRYDAECCFTLGDVGPTRLPVPHAVLLHQNFIAYRLPEVERLWPQSERLKFRFTRWQFGRMAPNCAAIFVQTPVMAQQVCQTYRLPQDRVHVVLQTIPAGLREDAQRPREMLPAMAAVAKPFRLLFLAAGYEHKNHLVLMELARILRRRGLSQSVQIFVTLDPAGRRYEQNVLDQLAEFQDCVTNLGRLSRAQVAMAYAASQALFLPTLAESFGLIYLEAMAFGVPVLTSDRDFARWMCGEHATYFEPTDPESIADAIESAMAAGTAPTSTAWAAERLAAFPNSWNDVAAGYLQVLEECCD